MNVTGKKIDLGINELSDQSNASHTFHIFSVIPISHGIKLFILFYFFHFHFLMKFTKQK